VLAPDLPGHGASDLSPAGIGIAAYGRMLRAAATQLGLRDWVLVGHSMGCRAVLQAAVGDDGTPPPGLRGLALVDGAYLVPEMLGPLPPERRAALAAQAHARAAALYAEVEPVERARRGFAQMFFDERHAAVRDAMVARAGRLPATTARTLMPDFAQWDVAHMEPALARLRLPVLALVCTAMSAAHQRVQLSADARTPWNRGTGTARGGADPGAHSGRRPLPHDRGARAGEQPAAALARFAAAALMPTRCRD
jgi:pimeloyl-ACP methyl ester carboxylesterase